MTFLRAAAAAGAAFIAAIAASGIALASPFDSASVSSGADLSAFESVYIASVGTSLSSDERSFPPYGSGERPVSASDAAAKASDFQQKLSSAFGKSFTLASGPGPGVLTVDATLTRLQSNRPTAEDLRNTPGLSLVSEYAGAAAVRIVLSENGSTLAEVSDSYTGTLNDSRLRAGIWSTADVAFSRWASGLVSFVKSH
ncbi:MAG: DUF3313 family protein [Parvularculaceae bacterium]